MATILVLRLVCKEFRAWASQSITRMPLPFREHPKPLGLKAMLKALPNLRHVSANWRISHLSILDVLAFQPLLTDLTLDIQNHGSSRACFVSNMLPRASALTSLALLQAPVKYLRVVLACPQLQMLRLELVGSNVDEDFGGLLALKGLQQLSCSFRKYEACEVAFGWPVDNMWDPLLTGLTRLPWLQSLGEVVLQAPQDLLRVVRVTRLTHVELAWGCLTCHAPLSELTLLRGLKLRQAGAIG
jgi:hypothetical protein